MRSGTQAVPETIAADDRTLRAAGFAQPCEELVVQFQSSRSFMPSLHFVVTWWQFVEGRTGAGLAFLILFGFLLLAGGIFLVVRSVIDLVRNWKSSKRSEDVHRKKAA
jgi:hypothetical protein